AKHCPTGSIQYGDLVELRVKARSRVEELHAQGMGEAYLYGADPESQPGTGGLNAFFLLCDRPEKYNLPPDPVVPTKKVRRSGLAGASAALGAAASLFGRGKLPRIARRARFIAAAGAVASAGLLIEDLGMRKRFIYMLRVFRPTSPMNLGTWLLSAFGGCAAAALLPGRIGDAAALASGVV